MTDSRTFALIDALTLAGSRARPNDDRWGMAANRAWVIDGATGLGDPLMPGDSDAAWLAQRANEALHRHAGATTTHELLAGVAQDLVEAFERERSRPPVADWEIPCGSLILATLQDGAVEIVTLGDCRALLGVGEAAPIAFGATAESEAREAAFAARYRQTGVAPRYRSPEALQALRQARSRFAAPEGEFILAPDPLFLKAVNPVVTPLQRDADLLLMSDGFAAISLRYGLASDPELIPRAKAEGLAALAGKLRHFEEMQDPDGMRVPRWKRSDDATVVLVSIGVPPEPRRGPKISP